MNMDPKWKEERFRRMDKALTEIDEVVRKAEAEMPRGEISIATLAYWFGYAVGTIEKIGVLVNDGLTVPGEVKDAGRGSEEGNT